MIRATTTLLRSQRSRTAPSLSSCTPARTLSSHSLRSYPASRQQPLQNASPSTPSPLFPRSAATILTPSRGYRGAPLGNRPRPTVMKTELIGDPTAEPARKKDTLPYRVRRTKTGNLPVYRAYEKGRTQIITTIRRVDGSAEFLARELASFIPAERIAVSELNNHVVLQGDYVFAVRDHLTAREF
ncbi:mitochondrial large subunit ribosomal protein-domain-containing protein [Fimicolochytrium jonesii]|uniref:mitochondrial large subunit ribosomal protein-domain-containing protein n=1 Tax=Fimicolochytrium jonesii TaxID=1396493 RepID=UPI0022FE32E5|nr:mitochondrial large subunit ribosomal protein-domain-containing protein [Fimicolochytrium jonesii]KAI8821771.1 mitochondrial large subunit ribosomal protein-domain-containing protein [Fimicolochytrium jonesii]